MSNQAIISAIQNIAGMHNEDKTTIIIAEVNSVDKEARTANVTTISNTASNTYDVNLQAVAADGCIIIPSIGSTVLIASSKYTTPIIFQHSDIDEVIYYVNNFEVNVETNVKFNGGNYGGMVKPYALLDKLYDITTAINNIITWGKSLTINSTTGDLQGPLFPPTINPLPFSNIEEIANDKVTHGDNTNKQK